jgi:DNA-binding PadR family transcriptional regulator
MENGALQSAPLTEATFLILLSLATPKHGYGIMQDVAAWSGEKNKLGPGTLYGVLTKLLDQRLIRRATDSKDEDERRKSYVLTPAGRQLLEQECARLEWVASLGRRVLNGEGAA